MTHDEPFSWLQMTNMISYQGLVRTFHKVTAHLLIKGCKRVALIQGEPWMEGTACGWESPQALINHDLIP